MRVSSGVFVDGQWLTGGPETEVTNPYDGRVLATLATATAEQVRMAIESARETLQRTPLPQWQRAEVLERAAHAVRARSEELAQTICAEAGKPLVQARVEAARAADTLAFSAAEARRLGGEVIPMGASASGVGKLGLTYRRPLGVVAAITPFNFPLNLVAHKVGPALAAGNAVVLKPATATPLVALALVRLIEEAGLPQGYLQVVTGAPQEVGSALVEDERVAAITFTGSREVGWSIRARAPRKKVLLELGSASPLIVHVDGDWRLAADKAALHGFAFAGQSCVSVQRILVHEQVAEPFVSRLIEGVEGLRVGDPADEETQVGPLIDDNNARRVLDWIEQATGGGAELLTGGRRNPDGTVAPSVVNSPATDHSVWAEEVFGPVVGVRTYRSLDEAFALANDSRYGLQAGVFTDSLAVALRAVDALEFGGVVVNDTPTYRADQQPYGGVKESGNTREGPAYAVEELSEMRFASLQRLGG